CRSGGGAGGEDTAGGGGGEGEGERPGQGERPRGQQHVPADAEEEAQTPAEQHRPAHLNGGDEDEPFAEGYTPAEDRVQLSDEGQSEADEDHDRIRFGDRSVAEEGGEGHEHDGDRPA